MAWQKVVSATAALAGLPNITHIFGPSLSSSAAIYVASEPNYTLHVTQRWTIHAAPSYIGTIQPATVEDVQNIVRIAHSHDIPFLTTGGGHGVSVQMAELNDGLQIDMAKFNDVEFDAHSGLLTVGGSAKFSQLIAPLVEAGAQFPLGTAPCVGILGAALGAGVSANQGYAGLLADLLQEVQVVTASGDALKASRDQNPELFWALRGAGANFGIVTSATFKVPPTINGGNVTNANFMFLSDKALDVYKFLATLDDDMPAELALNIGSLFVPGTDQLALVINANFAGSPESATPYIEPLQELGPLRSEVLDVPWPEVFTTAYFGVPDTKACGRNQHVNMRSIGANHTDPGALVEFLDQLARFTTAHPEVQTAMMIHRFATDKVLEVPDSESVYPHRGIKMHIQLESEFDDLEIDDVVDKFLDSERSKLMKASGFSSPAVYVNFAHGDEGPEAWYGQRNLEKLTRLKQEWDPEGLFGFYNAVPPCLDTIISEDEL